MTPQCQHIKINGERCGSPKLNGGEFCYYHNRLHQTHYRYNFPAVPRAAFALGPVVDGDAIVVAISTVLNALASGQLDTKRAATLLYGLQVAGNNATKNATPAKQQTSD